VIRQMATFLMTLVTLTAETASGFYRATLCMRGTSNGPVSVGLFVSVCLSVCLSQVGALLKRLT